MLKSIKNNTQMLKILTIKMGHKNCFLFNAWNEVKKSSILTFISKYIHF